MIFPSKFGYASRHTISYHPKSKPGHVRLWSSYVGSGPGTDPTKNGDSALSELAAYQFTRSPLFGTDQYVSFSIGSDEDVFSILVALLTVKTGKDYSFKNYAGRLISFSRSKVGQEKHEVVMVSIRDKTDTGIITLKEIDEFEVVTRSILTKIGYSNQEIAKRTEDIIARVATHDEENHKN